MAKTCLKKEPKGSLDKIRKTLGKDHACYVLITCSDPSTEGNMDVEMSYNGDESLAAFLVENAQVVFDDWFHQQCKDSC